MFSKDTKDNLVNKYKKHENDCGSSEVQIILLTQRVDQISEHLKKFPKDYHSQRGLVKLVGQRRTLMNYLKRKDISAYGKLTKDLGV